MRALLAAAAIVLALAGCSAVRPPQPGLTDTELSNYYELRADTEWADTGLPDELRPPALPVQVVSGEEWGDVLADCMNDAGYDNYAGLGGGLSSYYVARPFDEAQAEVATLYSCQSAVRLDSDADYLLNPAEVEFLYDYYEQVLVPCLEVHNVQLNDAPTHAKFVETNAGWNPYYSVSPDSFPLLAEGTVLVDCPGMPPGMAELGISPQNFQQ